MEVQKLECKSASSEAQESTQGDKLPLLGQNLINRGKREAQTMGINGQLFGMFWLNQYTYSFKYSTKRIVKMNYVLMSLLIKLSNIQVGTVTTIYHMARNTNRNIIKIEIVSNRSKNNT